MGSVTAVSIPLKYKLMGSIKNQALPGFFV